MQKLTKKSNLFFKFIIDKNKFSGLAAPLLALAFIFIFLLLISITQDVIAGNTVAADTRLINLLPEFRSDSLTKIFTWITWQGKWQLVLGLTATAITILWLKRKQLYIIPLLLTVSGSEICALIGKIAIHRPRPTATFYAEHSFSFPSGHAAIAVAFYGFLIYMFIRQTKYWPTKLILFFSGLFLILFIGFSRLYLGVHYLSDVWGGYLVGALWLIIGISLTEWLSAKK